MSDDEPCSHCGGPPERCTTACCDGQCGELDCRFVWQVYGFRQQHKALDDDDACDALARLLRETEERARHER